MISQAYKHTHYLVKLLIFLFFDLSTCSPFRSITNHHRKLSSESDMYWYIARDHHHGPPIDGHAISKILNPLCWPFLLTDPLDRSQLCNLLQERMK